MKWARSDEYIFNNDRNIGHCHLLHHREMPHIPINLETIEWAKLLNHDQHGSGAFIGIPRQRGGMKGRGIGGILASLIGMIPAFFRSPVGKELASVGKNIVSDVVAGNSLKDSAKTHARAAVKQYTGLGIKKKPKLGVKRRHLTRNTQSERSYSFKHAKFD